MNRKPPLAHRPPLQKARRSLGVRRLILGSIILSAISLTGCAGRVERVCPTPMLAEGSGSDGIESLTVATSTPQPPQVVREAWETGPHARTQVQSEPGFEENCRACHAPLEALSLGSGQSKQDASETPGVVHAAIGCAVCHPQEQGEEGREVARFADWRAGRYEPVESGGELCLGCHVADDLQGHLFVDLSGAHAGFSCTVCHDPHSGAASCTDSGCHQSFGIECEPIQSHDKPHAAVSCSGCHASGDVEIAWDPAREMWHSHLPLGRNGAAALVAFTSHDLSRDVECERCHTPGDLPWVED